MRKFLSISSGVALALLFCFSLCGLAANPAEPPAPAQDGTMPALTAIAGQGMMSNEAYDDLEELSDYIGGRVTGSTQAGQAIQWGIAEDACHWSRKCARRKMADLARLDTCFRRGRTGRPDSSPPEHRFHGLGRFDQRRRRRSRGRAR